MVVCGCSMVVSMQAGPSSPCSLLQWQQHQSEHAGWAVQPLFASTCVLLSSEHLGWTAQPLFFSAMTAAPVCCRSKVLIGSHWSSSKAIVGSWLEGPRICRSGSVLVLEALP